MSARALDRPHAVTRRQLMRGALAAAVLAAFVPRTHAQHVMTLPHGKPSSMVAAADARDVTVEIRGFAFVPQQLSVTVGTRVSWINRDDEAHLVASSEGAFKASAALDTDDRFELVFDKPGTYPYFCGIHPQMRGTVVVK